MAQRRNAEPGFIDHLTADLGGPRTRELLERLDASTPWEQLCAPIEELPEYLNDGPGHPTWPAITMVKSLMLAKWFNLSDPQLEECLQDRLSFRRFVGLSLTDKTPDETTFVVFRRRLREAGLQDQLFKTIVADLEDKGLLVRQGTLVDATIIEQSRGRKRDDGSSTCDEDATYTRKHGRTYHGYKGHIAVDRSGIVTDWRWSTGKDHDGAYLDEMTGDEQYAVLADAAYGSSERRAKLKARGVIAGIVYQRRRGQAQLEDWQLLWNSEISRLRCSVEHRFAQLKQQLGFRRVRYRGLTRNAFDFCMTLTAVNIRRGLFLSG